MIERVERDGVLFSIVVRREFREPGVHFFTPSSLSQQLAYMRHPAGTTIPPHVHNPVRREVHFTQEVLLIRSGVLRVDFYDGGRQYLESTLLRSGDMILLVEGGHGFESLEEVEMIEVKQGPFVGDGDKTRFDGVSATEIRLSSSTPDND